MKSVKYWLKQLKIEFVQIRSKPREVFQFLEKSSAPRKISQLLADAASNAHTMPNIK